MIFLLSVDVFSAVDSFFVPISRDVDPGSAGEGMLFLILGFRAFSRSELPILVLAFGVYQAPSHRATAHVLWSRGTVFKRA
jgi:hypothetical protein